MSNERFALTDHLCRKCGTGRILEIINGGPSGGGNPSFKCATCEAVSSGIGPQCLCWCNRIVDRGGLPFVTTCHRGEIEPHLHEHGWRLRNQHHALSVMWMYAPAETTRRPDWKKAAEILEGIGR